MQNYHFLHLIGKLNVCMPFKMHDKFTKNIRFPRASFVSVCFLQKNISILLLYFDYNWMKKIIIDDNEKYRYREGAIESQNVMMNLYYMLSRCIVRNIHRWILLKLELLPILSSHGLREWCHFHLQINSNGNSESVSLIK